MAKDFKQSQLYKLLKKVDADTRTETLKLLKNGKCDVNSRDELGNGYLHLICSFEDVKDWPLAWYIPIFYQLGLHGIDVNAQNNEGNTVLHFAVTNQLPLRALNVLMKLGGDATLSNNQGLSPVHLAADTAFAEMVNIMYEGFGPALRTENEKAVDFLLSAWCYPNNASSNGVFQDADLSEWPVMAKNRFVHVTLAGDVEQMKQLYDDSIDFTYCDQSNLDWDGNIVPLPLICDVYALGLLEPLKFMTKKRPCSSITIKVDDEDVPFWLHMLKTFTSTERSMVLPLLRDINTLPPCVDVDFMTSLFVRSAPPELIWKLITCGFDLSRRDEDGRTIRDRVFLHSLNLDPDGRKQNMNYVDQQIIHLVTDNRLEELKRLLDNGYDHILVANMEGRSVLSIAKKQKVNEEVIKFLEGVSNWQIQIRAIQRAIAFGNLPNVRDNINAHIRHSRDKYGRTYLHLAALYNRGYIMRLLLQDEHCRDLVNATDTFGRRPFQYAACVPDGGEVERLLRAAGAESTTSDDSANDHFDYEEERSLPDLGLDIYLLERYLLMGDAIKRGMRDRVSRLCETMYLDCDVNMLDDIKPEWKVAVEYKHLLELCVNEAKEEIAIYLLRKEIKFEHLRLADQYEPDEKITLGEAAQQKDMYNLVRQIKKQKAAKKFEEKVNEIATVTDGQRRMSDCPPPVTESVPDVAKTKEGSEPCLRQSTVARSLDGSDSGVGTDSDPVENSSSENGPAKKSSTCIIA